jgi:hypothetical protein
MDASAAPATPAATPEDTGPDTSFTGALRYAFDQPLENMAITSKALGGEGIASFLSGLTEAPAGYQPASEGFMNEDGALFDFSYLPRAAVEQTGQFVGSIGTRAAGALLGGAAGSVIPGVGNVAGAATGAIAGPALFEAVQVLGPVALERAKNNGRDEPNAEDWLGALSTAGVSGALNAIAPGLSGFVRKTIAEAGTEGLQSVVQQAGGTAATEAGLEIDPRQAAAEAILGGTAAGIVTAPFAIAEGRAAKRDAAKKADEKALSDLEEDQKEEAEDAAKRIAFGDAAMAPPPPAEAAPEKPKMPETTSELISTLVSSRARPTDTEAAAPSAPLPPVPGALQLPSYSGIQTPAPAAPVAEAVPPTQQAPAAQTSAPALETLRRARERQLAGSNQLVSKKGAQRLADAGLLAPEDLDVPAVANAKVNELLTLGPEEVTRRMQGTQPTPTAPPAPESLVTPDESLVTPEAPRPAQPFRWRDYTAATQAVVNAKDASVPAIQKAASADPKKPLPPVVAKAIRDRMVADGVIVADKKSKGGFRVIPTRVPDVDQTESYRRTLDDLQQDAQEATAAQQKALLDARRAEQAGSKADARKFNLQADSAAETLARIQATRQEVEARLPRAAAETAVPRTEAPLSPVADGKAAVPITEAPPRAQATAVSDRAKRLKQSMDYYQREAARKAAEARRLRESGKKVQLPKSDQQRMLDLERDAAADVRMAQGIRAALARPASDIEQDRIQKTAAAAKEASVAAEAAARAPIYTAKEGQLFTAFRRRLDNLGLSDVKLVAERVIRPANAPKNALIEGMMEVDRRNGNRIISLALGVYDPKMTQQELFDAISAVMNHEVIHAIRSLGLFTDGEWKTLSDLAARQRYMKVKDGKSVERGYTYLQRAQQMYASDSAEIQSEEAVAEMFRDYVAGRLKIGGKPKTLMDRIKGFFKALWGAHAEAGLTDPNAIFEGVRFGDIGRRERKAEAAPDGDARLSRLIATDNPGGEWLNGKRRRAENDMLSAPRGSSRSKGLGGSITAYMPKPVNLPVDRLSTLTGAEDEVRRAGDPRYDALAADASRRGFLPDQDGNAVVVGVNHLGQAYLLEGNTRVAVARDFGVPSVRAEVRWFNGGELADGPFSPSVVERIAESTPSPSSPVITESTRQRLSVLRTNNRSTDLVRGIDELVQYAEEQSSWRDWYDRYQSVLSDLFGDSSDLFRSLLSATSQAASVPANVGLAIKAYDQMLSGQPFTGFLPAVIKNLNRIRADEALSGRKIGEYGRANEGDDQGIAIDRHIAMIMFDTVNPSAGQVEAGKAAIRTIAERLGWRPREVQAALWAANIKRTGKEPQSYDTFLIRKAEQIRAIRERFPTSVDRRDDQGVGAGRGADVGTAEDGQRFSIIRGAVSQPDTTVAGGLTSKGYIKVSDLDGAMITPIFADLTSAGNVYDQLDGMAVAPTTYMGGPNFPWLKAFRDANVVWAFNDKAKITALRNKVLELRKLGLEQGGDGRVVVTVLAMKDDAHTSNEMSISSLINTLNAVVASGKFPQSQLDAAKGMIVSKAGKKDEGYSGLATFPGFNDAAALADWSRAASFTTRKALATEMQSAAFQSLEGMFPVSRIVREAVDPDYRATQQGDMLLAFEIDPDDPNLVIDFQKYHTRGDRKPYGRYKDKDGKTYRVPRHPAYQFGLRGKLLGSFSTHIPMEIMYGDLLSSTYNRIGANLDREQEVAKKKAERDGREFTPLTPEEREKAIALKQRNWTPKFALERSRTTDGQLVTPQIVREAEAVEGLHDYRVAQAMLAGVAGRWRSSDNTAVSGGIQPVEFERALAENEAAATLTKYTRTDVQEGQKDGSLRVFQLGSTPVKDGGLNVWMGVKRGADYRDIYPSDLTDRLVAEGVLSDSEVALVGVVNNELGVSGMTTFQVLKGIEEGVTVLDAFKVKSASKPYGLLPSIYGTLGFEEVGEIPFDPQYYTAQQIDDLKAVWSRQGWLEEDGMPSVSIMKWRGDDAARSEASKRFVLEGQDGLGIRGEPDLVQFDTEAASILDGDVAGDQGDGITGQGDGRANPRRFADRARDVSGRARDFVQNILKADDSAIKALKLPRDLIDKIKADYAQDQVAEERPISAETRLSIRYAVSPSTAAIRRNIQSNQKDLMYARSSDVLAGLISKTRLVDEKAARRFTDGVLRRFQDSMIPIGRMVQELSSRGMTIVDAMDPYLQEMLMHGVVGNKITANQKGLYEPVANAIKRINVPQAKIDQLITASNLASKDGKGYVSLAMKQGDSPRMVLADAYLYARHAVERNRYIKANKDKTNDSGSGMTDAEANAILQWFKSLDANNTQALADVAKGIRLIVADTNHNRVDGGLIAADTDDPYNFYVPLRGITDGDSNADEDSFSGPPSTPRLGARGREDPRALGRSDYAANLVANVFSQNQNAILRSERNKVGQSLLRLLRADAAKTSDFAEVLPYAPKTRAQLSGARQAQRPDRSAYDEDDILVVKEDGKEVFIRFEDPIVAGAMNGKNGFSPGSSSALLNAMQRINSYLATINTSYNPEFVISNMARDLTTAGVNINQFEMDGLTADALKNLKSALVGLKRSIINKDDSSEWAKIYKDFAAAGGQNVTNQVSTLADQMANIQSILGDISDSGMQGKWNSVKNSFVGKGVGSILNTMENINTVVENGIRVATYKAMIDRGVSKQRAAQAARNITVNFAKGGDYRQFMGAWSLFYNASIQGSFALINAATRSKRVQKIWLGAMAAGFLMDQLNSLLSDEDDEGLKAYDQLEDYVLEHNFVIIDPLGVSERGYITIPMPYGLNVLYNAGRSISAVGRGKDTAGEATSNIFRTFVDSFNPIGGYDSFFKLAAPTVADPFVELMENKDFAGRSIFKEALPFDKTPAPDSQMYWTTTSPSAVWISNTLNSITGGNEVRPGLVDVSPNVLEYWFDLVTGGVGKFVQRTVESPLAIAEEGFTEEVVRDIPLLRKVVGSVSSREDMGTYIDGAKAILTAGEELKRAREVGDAAWAKQTIQRYGKELRLVGPIKSLESALREASKMRNQINANPNIPDEQKKVLLDRIDERRQMILKRANSLIRDAGL